MFLPALMLTVSTLGVAPDTGPAIVPRPAKMTVTTGQFVLNAQTKIVASASLRPSAHLLQSFLKPASGFPLSVASSGKNNSIILTLNPDAMELGDEGYRLSANSDRVEIIAKKPAGVFYGIQTLRQLLPPQAFSTKRASGVDWALPSVEIEDTPRFRWRGLMLDTGRYFMPMPFLYRFVDLLAMHKMNTFHLHLTEDQGWRIEIKRYPKLTEIGSKRTKSMLVYPDKYEDKPHGGFYTQKELKELVRYAQERNVNIVPEIEMPGHSQAAIASYPELGVTGKPIEVSNTWGVHEDILNAEYSTVQFMQNVLDEVLDIFPSQFIHIGGDEAPKAQWKASARTQALMAQRGIKTEAELQSWFIRQMDRYLTSKGRRLIGWDEILEGGLAENATVMCWRGIQYGIAAAQSGHDVVMGPTSHTYFDYYQSRKPGEPHAIGGYLPLETVYAYEPIPAALTPDEAKHILGSQGQIWTEYIPNPERVEYMAFPRAAALAEVVWSRREDRDYPNFRARLDQHVERLGQMGVNYRKLDPNVNLRVGGWRSGEIGAKPVERIWELGGTITQPGTYSFTFQYTGGSHRLEIDWVEILEGDRVVSRVDRQGVTGARDENNEYRFSLAGFDPTVRHRLRAKVRADGGNDSNGDIFAVRVTAEKNGR
ncbi:MAG: beta-N-acetylhexosaminidase [Fimbriimonas sp.]